MFWLYLLIFYWGGIWGSFFYVVVSRSLAHQSWARGRSRCDHCQRQIAWFDNLPLLSFLFLAGKCRYCRKSIDGLHFGAEVAGGLVLLAWWQLTGQFLLTQFSWSLLLVATIWLLVGFSSLIIFLADLKEMIIPDKVTGFLGFLAVILLLWQWSTGQSTVVIQSLLSAGVVLVIFALIFVLTKGKGMGWGDVKLAPVLALFLGWPATLVGFFAAVLSGSLVGVALLLAHRHRRRQPIAFGPFLIFGFWLAALYGEIIWHWYWTLLF